MCTAIPGTRRRKTPRQPEEASLFLGSESHQPVDRVASGLGSGRAGTGSGVSLVSREGAMGTSRAGQTLVAEAPVENRRSNPGGFKPPAERDFAQTFEAPEKRIGSPGEKSLASRDSAGMTFNLANPPKAKSYPGGRRIWSQPRHPLDKWTGDEKQELLLAKQQAWQEEEYIKERDRLKAEAARAKRRARKKKKESKEWYNPKNWF